MADNNKKRNKAAIDAAKAASQSAAQQASITAQMEKQIELLKQQAQVQANVSTSVEGYIDGLKKLKLLQDTITKNDKIRKTIAEKLKGLSEKDQKIERQKLKILKDQTDELRDQADLLKTSLEDVNKTNLMGAKAMGSLIKGFAKLPDLLKGTYGEIKKIGIFEWDKAMRKSALSMGLLSKQTDSFYKDISNASYSTNQMGIGVTELAKMQADYSDALGRTVELSKSGLKAMGEMASATGLGAEGASKMAADMDNQGLSAERTKDFIEQTMNDSHEMGLNASKVIKNIASNIKMLNRYNFKGGIKGLEKMAQTVTKLGIDMTSVGNMADKLFDIEGAVDMSAQLQVMGGAWAKLADPFKLMYQARNDMGALVEEIGEAAKSSVKFNKENGQFEISAMEMHRLRKIAEQTGIAYEDLAQAGKNAAKFTEIKKQMNFSVDKKTQEFLSSVSKFNNKGEAYIEIDDQPKLLKSLSAADTNLIKQQMIEKSTLEDRAKAGQNFDDQLKNSIDMFKTSLLPLITTMNKELMPKLQALQKRFIEEKWADKIEKLAETVGKVVSFVGGVIADFPKTFVGLFVGANVLGFFFQKANWIMNGLALSEGFNLGTTGQGGSFLQSLTKLLGSQGGAIGSLASSVFKLGGYVSLAAQAFSVGKDAVTNVKEEGWAKGLMQTLKDNAFKIAGGVVGGVIGGLTGGPAGAMIGAGYGADLGSALDTKSSNNGVGYGNPVHDGVLQGSKTDFSKGRGIIDSGKITPIDNKDSLLAYKPGGPIASSLNTNTPQKIQVDFGEINFHFDDLRVVNENGQSVSIDILKDQNFIRSITRMVHSETEKVINGGKSKG